MKAVSRRAGLAAASVAVCGCLFLILLFHAWPYVGVAPDESFISAQALGLALKIPGMLLSPPLSFHFSFLGWTVPLMAHNYQPPWSIYTLAPFVLVGGGTLAPLRAYAACLFLLALWGVYRLAEALYRDWTVAFLAALLLAVNPSLVLHCELRVMFALGLAASVWTLHLGLRFARERKPWQLVASCAAFFAGLGSANWLAALGIGLLLCLAASPRRCLALLPKRPRPRLLLLGACALCAAFFLLPVVLYNVETGGRTFKFFSQHLSRRVVDYGCALGNVSCSNLDYWTNLKGRLAELAIFSAGDLDIITRPHPYYWSVYAGPLLLSLLETARNVWKRRSLTGAQAAVWLTALGYLLISPFSPTDEHIDHLLPLIPILAVLFFAWPASRSGWTRRAGLALAALLCAAQFAADFRLLDKDHLDPGDFSWYSPALIEACHWAGERPRAPIISLSVAFRAAAPYFSQNRARLAVSPADLLENSSKPAYWKTQLRRKDHPYFLVERDMIGEEQWNALQTAAAQGKRPLKLVKVFATNQGRPAFEVYESR